MSILTTTVIPTSHFMLSSSTNTAAEREPSLISVQPMSSLLAGFGSHWKVDISEVQEPAVKTVQGLDALPVPCDTAASYLDFAVIDTRKLEGTYLIMIARLGNGETSRRLNQRRLTVVEEYVLRRGSDLKYVLAEGRRVRGRGRIELYVGGQLVRVLPFEQNADGYCLPGREGW
jgi:hypothetical protein